MVASEGQENSAADERDALRLTERQHQVAARLRDLQPVLGDLFEAAVRQLKERANEAWIRLAAHACREIVNRAPSYLDVPILRPRLDYVARVESLAEHWPREDVDELDTETVRLAGELIREHRAITESLRDRAERLFRTLENAGAGGYIAEVEARAQMWVKLQQYFHSVAHLGDPGSVEPDAAEFVRYFDRLERLLASQFRAERFYESQADLEQLLAKAEPTEEDADAVVALLRGELYRTFFAQISSPAWLPLLRARGMFRRPPDAIVEGQYIRFPFWPQSGYLARIAGAAAGEVVATIREMEVTNNPRVHSDLLEAALAMPVEEAAAIARLAGPWLEDTHLLLVTDPLRRGSSVS